ECNSVGTPTTPYNDNGGETMAFLRGVLLVVIGIYLIVLIVAVFFSEQLIFQPQQAGYRDNAAILKLTSSDGAKISATYLPNPDATFTVLFSHGNAEDIGDDQPLLERIRPLDLRSWHMTIRATARAGARSPDRALIAWIDFPMPQKTHTASCARAGASIRGDDCRRSNSLGGQ